MKNNSSKIMAEAKRVISKLNPKHLDQLKKKNIKIILTLFFLYDIVYVNNGEYK